MVFIYLLCFYSVVTFYQFELYALPECRTILTKGVKNVAVAHVLVYFYSTVHKCDSSGPFQSAQPDGDITVPAETKCCWNC